VLGAALVSGEADWPAGAPICSGGVWVAGGGWAGGVAAPPPAAAPALLSGAELAAPLWAGAAPDCGIMPACELSCVVAPVAGAAAGGVVAEVFAAAPVGAADAVAVVSRPQFPLALARGEAFKYASSLA